MRILLKDLQPSTHYLVQLRSSDETGRVSDWSRLFDLITTNETTPPAPPTELTGRFNQGNLSFSWKAPTLSADGTDLDDLKDYEVTITPVPADPEWRPVIIYVEGTAVEFTREDNIAAFGRFRAGIHVEVRARDILDNRSDPAIKDFVKARPNPPTGLAWNAVRNSFSGSWTAPTLNTDGTIFDDPDGYEVTLLYTEGTTTTRVKFDSRTEQFTFSYEQNKANFGGLQNTAKTPLTIEVRARDSTGQVSDPATATAGNQPPPQVTGVTATDVIEGIRVTWNGSPDDDVVAYEIWSAGDATTAGTLYGRVGASQREYIHQTVAYNQDHYLYVTAVDEFGSRSVDSARSGPVRPRSPFTVDTTPPAATTLTTATPARASTDPAAVALSWTAVTDADLAGYHIRFSKNTATREWLYHDVIDKAATTTTIEGLASNTVYVFQIRSYDTMINPSAWSAEVLGTSSVSTLKEIVSEIQIVPGGILRSSNFNETDQTGWRLMDSGLDILSGRVNARVVSAGTLISSQTVNVDGTVQPAWSLNLAGNASLNDVQVRGKIVVGAGSGSGAVNIASANYGGTGSQWAIKGDGSIDLKAGATDAAGAPIANSLHISSSGIIGRDAGGNVRIHMNTAGQFTMATTNGGVRFDDNGIYGYSGATNTFYINRNGAAFFEGTVRAGGGLIGGWNLAPNNFYAGNLNLRSDLGMIYGGDGTARVAMRAGYGFWAGHNDHASAPFRVNTDGYLYSIYGHIGGWTINNGSLSGNGTISGGNVTGAIITGGTIQTATGGNRVVIAPNDGIDINFYSSHSSSPGYIDTRGRLVGSALNRDTYMALVAPLNAAFTTRPSITMRSFEGSGQYIYYNCPSGSHQFRDSVSFDNRPYINGVGWVENQGHGHPHGHSALDYTGDVYVFTKNGQGAGRPALQSQNNGTDGNAGIRYYDGNSSRAVLHKIYGPNGQIFEARTLDDGGWADHKALNHPNMSDPILKGPMEPVASGHLDRVKNIQTYRYDFLRNDDKTPPRDRIGVDATSLPDLVTVPGWDSTPGKGDQLVYGVDPAAMDALLLGALKELAERVEQLEEELATATGRPRIPKKPVDAVEEAKWKVADDRQGLELRNVGDGVNRPSTYAEAKRRRGLT